MKSCKTLKHVLALNVVTSIVTLAAGSAHAAFLCRQILGKDKVSEGIVGARKGVAKNVLNTNELVLLENLIQDGVKSASYKSALSLLKILETDVRLHKASSRSRENIQDIVRFAVSVKFKGMNKLMQEVREDLVADRAKAAMQKLQAGKKLMDTLADYRLLTAREGDLLVAIEKVMVALQPLNIKNAQEFDLAHRVFEALPGDVIRSVLRDKFDQKIDVFDDVVRLGKELDSYEHPVKRVAMLRDVINKAAVDADSAVSIYGDNSGSMGPDRVALRNALTIGLVDQVTSNQKGAEKILKNEIRVNLFDDRLIPGNSIKTASEAKAFVANSLVEANGSGQGGTDIQAALVDFYHSVARGKAKSATMILISDGGAFIDMKAVNEARATIPADVKVAVKVIGIGDEGQAIGETLALGFGNEFSTVAHFTNEQTRVIQDAQGFVMSPEAFISFGRVDNSIVNTFDASIGRTGIQFRQSANMDAIDKSLSTLAITKLEPNKLTGLLELNEIMLLDKRLAGAKLDSNLKQRIVEAIIQSYPSFSGRNLDNMTHYEKDVLENLRRWAAN